MGASWLHRVCNENPLAPLIGRLGLPLYRTSNDNSVLFDHDLERSEGLAYRCCNGSLTSWWTWLNGSWLPPCYKHPCKGLDIHLNHRVTRVVRGNKGVEVTTENGKTFRADAAVITLPLGVLKANAVTFEPKLPDWKQEAISGRLAHDIEKLSDEEAAKFAFAQLRTILPDATEPINFLVSHWGTDRNSLGSYSYDAVGKPRELLERLRIPSTTSSLRGSYLHKVYWNCSCCVLHRAASCRGMPNAGAGELWEVGYSSYGSW
ncbi:hypothetical protein HPP92_011051 [Vanilla planifolia]|uniref:Amine oxidase domain-containing protein n=1 Tax=Vanilla planifolia TaxID=51239 RepID=A0A835QYA1_VANPL|nr:hypothetical protein HPP92_011051 [Vanilla planifolia]